MTDKRPLVKCVGIFGKLFGHSYEACLDTKSSRKFPGNKVPEFECVRGFVSSISQAIESMKEETKSSTYVQHVCTRCGHKIDRYFVDDVGIQGSMQGESK